MKIDFKILPQASHVIDRDDLMVLCKKCYEQVLKERYEDTV